MSRQSKAVPAANGHKKVVFPKRISIRLDDDVRALANASVESGVEWVSQSHAINSGLRRAFQPFAPEGFQLCVSPFEQLVFAKRISIKRLK